MLSSSSPLAPKRTVSAPSGSQRCHICRDTFTKSALPAHQRQCIKKTFSRTCTPLQHFETNRAPVSSAPLRRQPNLSAGIQEASTRKSFSAQYASRAFHTTEVHSQRSSTVALPDSSSDFVDVYSQQKAQKRIPSQHSIRSYPPVAPAEEGDNAAYDTYSGEEENEAQAIEGSGYAFDEGATQAEAVERRECNHCGRKFNVDVLTRHKNVCSKSKNKKDRKVFDVRKQRLQGTEAEKYNGPPSSKAGKEEKPIKTRKANWRVQHENFLRMVRAAREPDSPSSKRSGDKSSMHSSYPPSGGAPVEYDDGLVPCSSCSRRFSEASVEKHIEICSRIKQKEQQRKANAAASKSASALIEGVGRGKGGQSESRDDALKRRTAYRPPPPPVKKAAAAR